MQDCPKYKSIMLPSLHSLCITLNRSYVSSMNMLWSRTINDNISTNWSNQHSFTKHFNNIIMIAEFYHTSTNESQNRKTKTISFQLSIVTREHTNTLTTCCFDLALWNTSIGLHYKRFQLAIMSLSTPIVSHNIIVLSRRHLHWILFTRNRFSNDKRIYETQNLNLCRSNYGFWGFISPTN